MNRLRSLAALRPPIQPYLYNIRIPRTALRSYSTENDDKRRTRWELDDEDESTDKRDDSGMLLNNQPNVPKDWRNKSLPGWKKQMFALKEKFHNQPWNPQKKLSRETMDKIRDLKEQFPEVHSGVIAEHFKISPEAVRRILRSKWRPSTEEEEKIKDRWTKRGERIRKARDLPEPSNHSNKSIQSQKKHSKTDKFEISNKPRKKPQKPARKDLGDMYF
ncbi:required for respiratory growth protein 9, mitochondrial [Trichomonascus vanleenenianus]|uniref:mitochondrial ribosome assembly protein RRG9 n=1 Tax=Trichomonascus vanleenenianus TaxID=2268995 RepID=UPI003ECB9429